MGSSTITIEDSPDLTWGLTFEYCLEIAIVARASFIARATFLNAISIPEILSTKAIWFTT